MMAYAEFAAQLILFMGFLVGFVGMAGARSDERSAIFGACGAMCFVGFAALMQLGGPQLYALWH